jgi:hypothetical protein
MIFVYNNQRYAAQTAAGIVRAIEKDSKEYPAPGAAVRDFIEWSLAGLCNQIHNRELVASTHVSEETLALNYLCLLDEHRLGSFSETKETAG